MWTMKPETVRLSWGDKDIRLVKTYTTDVSNNVDSWVGWSDIDGDITVTRVEAGKYVCGESVGLDMQEALSNEYMRKHVKLVSGTINVDSGLGVGVDELKRLQKMLEDIAKK